MGRIRDWGSSGSPRDLNPASWVMEKSHPSQFLRVRGTAPLAVPFYPWALSRCPQITLMPKFLCGSHQGAVLTPPRERPGREGVLGTPGQLRSPHANHTKHKEPAKPPNWSQHCLGGRGQDGYQGQFPSLLPCSSVQVLVYKARTLQEGNS